MHSLSLINRELCLMDDAGEVLAVSKVSTRRQVWRVVHRWISTVVTLDIASTYDWIDSLTADDFQKIEKIAPIP